MNGIIMIYLVILITQILVVINLKVLYICTLK